MLNLALGCFAGFEQDAFRSGITLVSLLLAFMTLMVLKKLDLTTKKRIALIYTHLSLLFFPAMLPAVNLSCGFMCMPCYNQNLALVTYSMPATLFVSMIAGFVVIPAFYIFSSKKMVVRTGWVNDFVRIYSARLGISQPRVYAVDKAKPMAFSFSSFKSAVFVSVGMLEMLTKKELQAVLLHELAHLKEKSSMLKFSSIFMRFSPLSLLARFHYDRGMEETKADSFAAEQQGTERYLNSAKRKVNEYLKQS